MNICEKINQVLTDGDAPIEVIKKYIQIQGEK